MFIFVKIFLLIATVLLSGYSVVFFKEKRIFFQYLLGFSGAVLLGLIVHHLLPEIYADFLDQKSEYKITNSVLAFALMSGFLIQLILDYSSKGVEHGHFHQHEQKFPVGVFISLCIHAFLEGFPLEEMLFKDSNYSYLWAILIHKIPISMTLMILVPDNFSSLKKYFLLGIFGAMAVFGAISQHFLFLFFEEILAYSFLINAVITGMLLHISTIILLENQANHKFNLGKLIAILIGFGLSFLL